MGMAREVSNSVAHDTQSQYGSNEVTLLTAQIQPSRMGTAMAHETSHV